MGNILRHKILLILIIILVVVGILGWAERYNIGLVKKPNLPLSVSTTSSPSDNNLNNQRKKSSTPASTLNNGPTSNTSTNTSSSSSIRLTVTRASVINDSLQVGTLVSGTTTGSCILSVSQTGQTTITRTNQVTQENNSYTCPVFSIPLSQFPNQGYWYISVSLTSNGNTISSNWANNPVNL